MDMGRKHTVSEEVAILWKVGIRSFPWKILLREVKTASGPIRWSVQSNLRKCFVNEMIGVRKIQRALSDRWEILCSTTAGIWSKPCGGVIFSGNDFNTYNYNMDEIRWSSEYRKLTSIFSLVIFRLILNNTRLWTRITHCVKMLRLV